MSGPKRADVVAALNNAQKCRRGCQVLISSAETANIESILQETGKLLKQMESGSRELKSVLQSLTPEIQRVLGDKADAIFQAQSVLNASGKVQELRNEAGSSLARMQEQETNATRIFDRANKAYQSASDALNRASGDHYMQQEKDRADEARHLYEQASSVLATGARHRKEAEQKARTALNRAKEAVSAIEQAQRKVLSIRTEAQARLKAEEDARRITEQKKRDAVIAVEKAKAAFQSLEDLPHEKFHPGGAIKAAQRLDSAETMLRDNRFDEAASSANQAGQEATRLIESVSNAWQEFQRRKAEAEGNIQVLRIAFDNLDRNLISTWADDQTVLRNVETALQKANQEIENENFDQASEQAKMANDLLSQSLHNAAENQSLNEKREVTCEAIMDALEELGFETAYQSGNRTSPLRIAGHTPDIKGKGDFAIDIPLDGNVDFKVTAAAGDTSCVAAVQDLQKRLAQRGIRWETTNWGHADGVKPAGTKTQVKEAERVKIKG